MNHIKMSFNILDVFLGILLCMVLIVSAKTVEEKYFPVIRDFEVLTVEKAKSGLILNGTLNKVRNCQFRNIIAYVKINNQSIPFPTNVTFDDFETQRQAIRQTWGPWTVMIPYEYTNAEIEFYATHNCFNLHSTRTKLSKFSVVYDETIDDYKIVRDTKKGKE